MIIFSQSVWIEVTVTVCGGLTLFCALGESAAPGGPVFALELTIWLGVVGGRIAEWIKERTSLPIPSLLGMLIAGLLAGSLPGLRKICGQAIDTGSSSAARTAALALILARAGLGLDADALAKYRFSAIILAVCPCLVEATVVGILSYFFFQDFTPSWCATLGFVVAAVSPAVVVPSLLGLEQRGYGRGSGVPTLVVAAAALDDVLSLSGFGVSLGFAVSVSSGPLLPATLWADAIRAPLEIVSGLLIAFIGATIFKALLGLNNTTQDKLLVIPDPVASTAVISALCLVSTFGLKRLGLSGASALSTLALSFLAGRAMGKSCANDVGSRLSIVWSRLGQPALFALLGAAVNTDGIRAAGPALGLLAISLVFRFFTTLMVTCQRPWNERIFIALAWLPKATVQAAIGAVPLDAAESNSDQRRGQIVLAVSVVAVLVTAPLGALAIAYTGPKLLHKEQDDHSTIQQHTHEDKVPHIEPTVKSEENRPLGNLQAGEHCT
mmetsp:Transcript_4912/g.7373  ORF Transcript_4912/g.7373 Transcript_4912/m.7373 type:complete len:496 (+) Transcript_4912:12-1499(+)